MARMTDASSLPGPAGAKVVGHVVMEVSDVERALAETGSLGLRRLLLWPVLLAAFFLISLLTNSDSSWEPRRTIVPVVLGVSFWVGLLLYARKSGARKTLEGKTERDRSITFELDPAGYSISTPTSSSRSDWSNLHRYHEGKSAFLLYLNPTVHQILPKRAFSDDDVAKVRALLAAHVTQRPAGRSRRTAMILLWAVLVIVFLAIWQFVSMSK
jgi:YcxB-like protein